MVLESNIVMLLDALTKYSTRLELVYIAYSTSGYCNYYIFSYFHSLRCLRTFYVVFQNFLFTSKDENSLLKAIDFGLSDFVRPGSSAPSWFELLSILPHGFRIFPPLALSGGLSFKDFSNFADERLNDIVGSAYYVAPEVLHRSYSTEADIWSIGVIAYILLCGSRPFWARTESGIFRAVLKADPSFDEAPWPSLSSEGKDFVKRLLNKDPRKRMSAAQALC